MPLNLAFIVGQLILGGAEQQLYYLLSGIDRSRFRPIVISLGATSHEYWEDPIIELGIPVRHITRDLGRSIRACRIIQVVHSWVFHINGYSALAVQALRSD